MILSANISQPERHISRSNYYLPSRTELFIIQLCSREDDGTSSGLILHRLYIVHENESVSYLAFPFNFVLKALLQFT